MSEVARGSTDLAVAPRRGGTGTGLAAPAVRSSSSLSSSRLVAREGSFRVYYTGSSGAIPFKWEARPGTPKHPSSGPAKSSSIPPLTPPPSFLSPGGSTPSQRLLGNRRQRHRHHATSQPPLGFRIMAGLVPKLFLWKRHADPAGQRSPKSVVSWAGAASSTSTSSTSSSESEAVGSPSGSPLRSCASSRRTRRGRSRFSSFSSTGTSSGAVHDEEAEAQKGAEEKEEEEDEDEETSCSPTTHGGVWRKSSGGGGGGGFSGCSANVVAVKRALMSVVVRAHGSGGQSATAPRKLGGTGSC